MYRQKGTIASGAKNKLVPLGTAPGTLQTLTFVAESDDKKLALRLEPATVQNKVSFTVAESKGSLQEALNSASKQFDARAVVK